MKTAPFSPTNKRGAPLIEAMAIYVASGKAESILNSAENSVGCAKLRIICINILSWLKARVTQPKMVSMKTREFGSAQAELVSLVEADGIFSTVFALDSDGIRLNNYFDAEEVEKMISLAAALHKPTRFVTRKNKE